MILFGLLCAVSLVLAARSGSRALVIAALVFAGGWVLYAASWNDYSFKEILHQIGLNYADNELWAFTDAIQALLIMLVARRHWWGWTLVSLFCLQEVVHDLYGRLHLYDWATYTGTLNNLFLMQISVLIVAGLTEDGDGLRTWHRLRGLRRVRAVSHAA